MSDRPRCTATVSYGTVWEAGRRRCNNTAAEGEALCRTHLRRQERQALSAKARETTDDTGRLG